MKNNSEKGALMSRRFISIPLAIGVMIVFIVFRAPDTVADPAPNEFDAVILDELETYTVFKNGTAKRTLRRVIEISGSEGKDYCEIILPESDLVKLEKFYGAVYDASGQKIYSFDKNDGEKICGYSGYALYSDLCLRNFILSIAGYPFRIEYEYRQKYRTLFLWRDWRPQKDIPVQHSWYQLTVPTGFEFLTRATGEIPLPSIRVDGRDSILTWKLADIPAAENQSFAVSKSAEHISLGFAPGSFKLGKYDFVGGDWKALGKSYHRMIEDCFSLNKEQELYVEKLLKNSNSQLEFCHNLHRDLSERLRYIDISIGIGGWRPFPSDETYDLGYGDCKALSTLYVSMLRHAGVQASTVLLLTRDKGIADPDFPRLYGFNHFILFAIADEDTVWIDPTCSHCPVGDLLWYDENVFALATDSNGGVPVITAPSNPDENFIGRKALVEVGDDKAISIRFTFRIRGNPLHRIQTYLQSGNRKRVGEYLKRDIFGLSDKLNIDSTRFEFNDREGPELVLTVAGKIRNAVHSIQDNCYLDISFFSVLNDREITSLSDRSQPINMLYPRTYLDSMIVDFPESWFPAEMPPDTVLSERFGTFSQTREISGNRITLSRERQTNIYSLMTADFNDYGLYRDAILNSAVNFIIFAKD